MDTIDQLLGYLTWRDTKAAILIVNKNKDFDAVLTKIHGALSTHFRFRRSIEFPHPSGFRAIFALPQEETREVIVTILAFDVPS